MPKSTNKDKDYVASLDRSGKKFECPNCGKRRFVRYVNNQTEEYLPIVFGKCDRIENCKYHNRPTKADLESVGMWPGEDGSISTPSQPLPEPEYFYHPSAHMLNTLGNYEQNHLFKAIKQFKGMQQEALKEAFEAYKVGTVRDGKPLAGSPIMWRIDPQGRIVNSKIMKYNSEGHRIKDQKGVSQITFTSPRRARKNKKEDPGLFFGSHLLAKSEKPVALAESEKTALICSMYLPRYTWLAAGGKAHISPGGQKAQNAFALLKHRPITLFPDLDAYDAWKAYAMAWRKKGYNIMISTMVEQYAYLLPGKDNTDLADILPLFDFRDFRPEYAAYPPSWDDICLDPEPTTQTHSNTQKGIQHAV